MRYLLSLLFILPLTLSVAIAQTVEKVSENEGTMRAYLDSVSTDPVEGIYKILSGTHYKIAIKKRDYKYIAIILESEDKLWKPGMVKAHIEESSIKGVFSVKWLLGNKTPYETIGKLEDQVYFTLSLPTGKYSSSKYYFLKLYPQVTLTAKGDPKSSKGISGSGFFVSKTGLIATNAHVVEGAKKMEVFVTTDNGSITYKAKLKLIDNMNDVAIIQIDDEQFKHLLELPYGIADRADIGEKAFTIGYPLNDIMGSNYKVTDGIISAVSGIEDDIRFYQVTVPLQPGNSGGPLFNNNGNIIGITTSKLNSNKVGTTIENVNYAIKSTYLSGLINMI
ncbi:MAG: S1C family serine protease, partial [Bacteroidia bacterium]